MKNILLLLFCSLIFSCQTTEKKQSEAIDANTPKDPIVQKDTMPLPTGLNSFQTIKIAGHELDIAMPKAHYRGNLIILQGYNFPKHDWCAKAPQLCEQALAEGYALIMPEMGKSIYSSEFFPETRADMQKQPRRTWLTDSVFSYLQERHNLLLSKQNNYILGLSTGGRGVALLALDRPELFQAVASLSGDFDQSKMPKDRLMAIYYGPYAQFQERWETVDNVLARINDWQMPIYLGHGQKDKVVPPQQTRLFYDSLVTNFDSTKVVLNEPVEAAHDYKYWGSETEAVLTFFKQYAIKYD